MYSYSWPLWAKNVVWASSCVLALSVALTFLASSLTDSASKATNVATLDASVTLLAMSSALLGLASIGTLAGGGTFTVVMVYLAVTVSRRTPQTVTIKNAREQISLVADQLAFLDDTADERTKLAEERHQFEVLQSVSLEQIAAIDSRSRKSSRSTWLGVVVGIVSSIVLFIIQIVITGQEVHLP